MSYNIKKQNNKWIVYTSGRTYNEWVFTTEKGALEYLDQCNGLSISVPRS